MLCAAALPPDAGLGRRAARHPDTPRATPAGRNRRARLGRRSRAWRLASCAPCPGSEAERLVVHLPIQSP
eukprot:scaffold2771_cov252-Pinguiococcus_pyrenoidosus.AAC.12